MLGKQILTQYIHTSVTKLTYKERTNVLQKPFKERKKLTYLKIHQLRSRCTTESSLSMKGVKCTTLRWADCWLAQLSSFRLWQSSYMYYSEISSVTDPGYPRRSQLCGGGGGRKPIIWHNFCRYYMKMKKNHWTEKGCASFAPLWSSNEFNSFSFANNRYCVNFSAC